MESDLYPHPTGEYKVGTVSFSATDDSRYELLGEEPGIHKRKICARLYYPVDPADAEGCPKAVLMSEAKLKALSKTFHVPAKESLPSECYQDAKPADGRLPLVIFSHGSGSYTESNNFMCLDLCSHGFNVLAVGHAYETVLNEYDDGTSDPIEKNLAMKVYKPYLPAAVTLLKMMRNRNGSNEEQYEKFKAFQDKYCSFILERLGERAKDIRFMTDEAVRRFGDRLNMENGIGVMGHSLGGATAYCLCQNDERYTCGINLDGMLVGHYDGMVMRKPFYQVSCDDAISTETRAAIDTDAPFYWELFKDMRHQGFSDLKYVIPVKSVVGKMSPDLMHENLCNIQRTFFGRFLKGSGEEVWYPDNEHIQRRYTKNA